MVDIWLLYMYVLFKEYKLSISENACLHILSEKKFYVNIESFKSTYQSDFAKKSDHFVYNKLVYNILI